MIPQLKWYLGFGDDLNGQRLVLELAFLASTGASMTEMPSPDLFPKLILSSEILAIPKALIQRLFRLHSLLLRNRTLFRLLPEPLRQRRLDMFRRRRRSEPPLKKPPRRRRPRRRRRHSPGERAGRQAVRVGTRPGARLRDRRPRRRALHAPGAAVPLPLLRLRRGLLEGGRDCGDRRRDGGDGGPGLVIIPCRNSLAVALPHRREIGSRAPGSN